MSYSSGSAISTNNIPPQLRQVPQGRKPVEGRDVVQLEIGIDKLESLFSRGELCATDIRCLNGESKKYLWKLCLSSCLGASGKGLGRQEIRRPIDSGHYVPV